MNKYQEALDEMCCGCYTSCSKDGKPCLAYMKLQELVDKFTPKKVISYINQGAYYYKCPSCKTKINKTLLEVSNITLIVTTNLTNFCPNCGQKLEWE